MERKPGHTRYPKSESALEKYGTEMQRTPKHIAVIQRGYNIERQAYDPELVIERDGENEPFFADCERTIVKSNALSEEEKMRFVAQLKGEVEEDELRLEKKKSLLEQLECPPEAVPVTLRGKVKFYCRRTKKYIRARPGTITLVIIGGAICVYLGYYIGMRALSMEATCKDAQDEVEDLMGLVRDVVPVCRQAIEHGSWAGDRCEKCRLIGYALLQALKNGTVGIAKEIGQQAYTVCYNMAETCNEMMVLWRKMTEHDFHPQ